MVWLKLFFLLFAVANGESECPQQSYLVYAVESGNCVAFYETDFALNSPQQLMSTEHNGGTLSNLFIGTNENDRILYWKYDHSNDIYRYDISSKTTKVKKLDLDQESQFLGLGKENEMYFYLPGSKVIKVFDYESGKILSELDGLKNSKTDMHCVDVDPRGRGHLFFAECSENVFNGKIFDVNVKEVLQSYEQSLPKCFDTWKITPDAKKVYAVNNNKVYISYEEGEPFIKYHESDSNILGFSAANNDLFYGTENGKLVKLEGPPNNNRFLKKEINVQGKATKLALHQHWQPEKYLIFVTEENGFPTFYKSDFNLENKEKLGVAPKFTGPVDRLYIGDNLNGQVLYWSYKGSLNIGRLEFYRKNTTTISLANGIFVGPGTYEDLYFYNPTSKTIDIHNIGTMKKVKTIKVTDESNVDFKFMSRNPCNKDLAYFENCSPNNTGLVFDLKKEKILRNYLINRTLCLDSWTLMPNADRVYAVKDNSIYRTNGLLFEEFYKHDKEIDHIAVGIDETFFTTGETRKIFKLTKENDEAEVKKTEYAVDGKVIALLVHQHVFSETCADQF